VQATALAALGTLRQKSYAPLFAKALGSRSYRVQGAALESLLPLNPAQALARARAFEADNKGALTAAMVAVYGQAGSVAQWPWVRTKYDAADPNIRFQMLPGVGEMLGHLDDPTALTEGITRIRDLTVEFKRYVDAGRLVALLRQVQQRQASRPNAALVAGLVDQAAAAIGAAK
jgi:aminopeptidase N